MRANKKLAMLVSATLLATAALAAPSVEITNVQQQYPWTNTVDITYTVAGVKTHQVDKILLTNETYFVAFEAKTAAGKAIPDVNGNTVITNALVNGSVTEVAQWNPALNLQETGCTMTPSVFRGEENAYLVINLETNALGKFDWWYEPMSSQEASNKRYNTPEYKTSKMVFRRIPAGDYTIGHDDRGTSGHKVYNDNGVRNLSHPVKVPADFYCAIFRLTQAQYERLAGGDHSAEVKIPKRISWSAVRGNALATSRAGDGILSALSEGTGLDIDLPTHAMHEVAIRARSRAYYPSGENAASWNGDRGVGVTRNVEYVWCSNNAKGTTNHEVGLLKPNPWGLYDCVGLEFMWLIDLPPVTKSAVDTEERALASAFVPITSTRTSERLTMDGQTNFAQENMRFSLSTVWTGVFNRECYCRLAIYPAEYYPNGGQE